MPSARFEDKNSSDEGGKRVWRRFGGRRGKGRVKRGRENMLSEVVFR